MPLTLSLQDVRLSIRWVHIRNWRAIRDVRIEPISRMNVLLGPNRSCKSAVLDAIRLALSKEGAKSFDQSNVRRDHGQPQFPCTISLGIRIENLYPAILKHIDSMPALMERISAKERKDLLNLWSIGVMQIHADGERGAARTVFPSLENTNAEGADFSRERDRWRHLHERAQQINSHVIKNADTTIKVMWKNLRDSVVPFVYVPAARDSWRFYSSPHVPYQISEGMSPFKKLFFLKEEGYDPWLNSTFYPMLRSLDEFAPAIDPRSDSTVFVWEKLEDRIESVPELRDSRGFRDTYMILAGIDDPCDQHKPLVVLLDEPELSKHERIQRTLLNCLHTYFPETTFFVATHSSVFAEERQETSLHFLRPHQDGVRSIFIATNDRIAIKELRDALGITNAQIFSVAHVLYLEGDTEVECISRILNALGVGLGPGSQLAIANARGVGNLNRNWLGPQLKILRDTWSRATIWADDEGRLKSDRTHLLQEFRDVIGDKGFVLWSDLKPDRKQFCDIFPRDLLVAAFKCLLDDDQVVHPEDLGSHLEDLAPPKVERQLVRHWYEIVGTSFPKARFGRKLGALIASRIRKGKAKGIEVVRMCQTLLDQIDAQKRTAASPK